MANRNNPVPGEVWIHYRGNEYTIQAIAEHTESNETLVVYRGGDGQFWARPFAMFMGMALSDVPRFQKKAD